MFSRSSNQKELVAKEQVFTEMIVLYKERSVEICNGNRLDLFREAAWQLCAASIWLPLKQ